MIETKLIHGDCLEKLKELPDCSVDSVVTDPPYGLSFMGKKWDYDVPSVEVWKECLRVLKPGGHLLAFAGTRTQHRMAVRIEDAGFEIRDMIAWVYGSGFPKSLDVSKAIDKAAGVEREVVGKRNTAVGNGGTGNNFLTENSRNRFVDITTPATEAARQWQGWGTALKPALEPITVARKPLVGTVAANVLEYGTGALNVDGCRVAVPAADKKNYDANMACHERYADGRDKLGGYEGGWNADPSTINNTGARWPANLIHDGSEEVVGLFPQAGGGFGKRGGRNGATVGDYGMGATMETVGYGDSGSAARFFYCAKSSKKDRGEGNTHPTVKPTDLMRYLCRLVTPLGGVVLDPFMGSGSTGKAAVIEGFKFIGIEREGSYMEIAQARINSVKTLV
jgi:site-specific DNA-methyltransferase (adenine-specific)